MSSAIRLRAFESSSSYPGGARRDSNGDYVTTAPTIGTLSPATGGIAGGTAVTIPGTNFYNIAKLTLGGVDIYNYTWTSATSLSISTPANTAGAKSLVVTLNDGSTVTKASAFTYA